MLHCHEVWQYNEETGIQWLRGFAALCRDCHDVKHLLFCRDIARHKELMRHFITVNRISPEETEAYLEAASGSRSLTNGIGKSITADTTAGCQY